MLANLKRLYCMVICLVCALIMLVSLAIITDRAFRLLLPEHFYIEDLIRYESNEKYLRSLQTSRYGYYEERNDLKLYDLLKDAPAKKIETRRMDERNDFLSYKKGRAISTIIDCFPWIIVSLIFFLFHWKIYRHCANES